MKDESAKIAAIVRIEGSMVWAGMEMSEAAAALDEECARLRERIAELERERDEARAQLAACPVGPAKDAPDASARMWLMVGGWPDPTWYRIVSRKWIRRNFRQLNERVPRNAKWFKLKAQP